MEKPKSIAKQSERSACGVGFVASRSGEANHALLQQAIGALSCVEHRGACASDQLTGDGAGIMADIPFKLLGYDRGAVAVATLFVTSVPERRRQALKVFEQTFTFLGLEILEWRPVPICTDVLGPAALECRPDIIHVIIGRPEPIRRDSAFNAFLYRAKQMTRSRLKEIGGFADLSFASLSTNTIVYKALTRSEDLVRFYPDLTDPNFETRLALFHRRFSTNTRSSWDRAQPFRMIAHNGEINTIEGNRSWSYSREQVLGLRRDELLTHENMSDSGSLNEQVEALRYRSSMPHMEDILAIMMPPSGSTSDYYRFWGRAMEPWDGPAFITYSDGAYVGARLDRNGFRPCRWTMTDDGFYLASEAGVFEIDESKVVQKGTLNAGNGVRVNLDSGEIHFRDPSRSRENQGAIFEPRLYRLPEEPQKPEPELLNRLGLFGCTHDELDRVLIPMISTGKEPIGSMGDTARLAVFSDEHRPLSDFFFQNFAQVTNPPLDYLRERMVTDLSTYLGRQPNIFSPKELIPPEPAFVLDSPVLAPEQMTYLLDSTRSSESVVQLRSEVISCIFKASEGADHLQEQLEALGGRALEAVRAGCRVLVLSDRMATVENPPIPSLLALRSVVNILDKWGRLLDASIVLDAGDIRSTHQVACAISFGAAAVSPYLAFEIASSLQHRSLKNQDPEERRLNLKKSLEGGLLKIMSKVGISVVRSYQTSKLFTPIGVGEDIISSYFPGLSSPIGGLSLEQLGARIIECAKEAGHLGAHELPKTYRFKEHNKGAQGERHAMTAARAKVVHQLVTRSDKFSDEQEAYARYLEMGGEHEPIGLSHLLSLRDADEAFELGEVEDRKHILKRFGSGAMSFGALSAEAQRDIFIAMREVGGRCNSGEGGENPYYFVDGTTATTKQIASGRFGVTAEYLMAADEFEIKMAQGAKPGEGGQLMGVKVNDEIARARHSRSGVDLISPPPMHDIYSIEDLKQLIYELKQFKPSAQICVKLVSGANIGTIAVGVAKAGADVIQVSGGSGGTGAASLSSMMHAGLPWELGLIEVHQTLIEQDLRDKVTIRVDGGLHRGRDIVIAAILGAEEFGFGKLLLVAQGCIMARICEQNRCPRGIATHDPKFKAKYRGESSHIVAMLEQIAEEIRGDLSRIGVRSLAEITGQVRYLKVNEEHVDLIQARGIDMGYFLHGSHYRAREKKYVPGLGTNPLNEQIVEDTRCAHERGEPVEVSYPIQSTDRAVPTRLFGKLAQRSHELRMASIADASLTEPDYAPYTLPEETIKMSFEGGAGQGFGALMVEGVSIELRGAANDAVCKSMSGGQVVIRPCENARYRPEENVIIGNCALYGATGGTLYIQGIAGDRFAVRNSGATSVVEAVGLHACEYMTSGRVVILGEASHNIGAGMTGGEIFLPASALDQINEEYIEAQGLSDDSADELKALLEDYFEKTGSGRAQEMLADWEHTRADMKLCVPRAKGQQKCVSYGGSEDEGSKASVA